MPGGGYVGTAGGNKRVNTLYVGTSTGRKEVTKAYVGTTGGNKQWYERMVQPNMTAVPQSPNQILLQWNDVNQGAQYNLYRTSPGAVTLINSGPTFTTYHYDSGLAEQTTYTYRLDVVRGGNVLRQAIASAYTPTSYVPTFGWVRQAPADFVAWTSASYSQSGGVLDSRSTVLMCGSSASWPGGGSGGSQKSTWNFSIPQDYRSTSTTRMVAVEMKVRVAHTGNATGQFGLVVHHNSGQGFGSAGVCTHPGGQQLTFYADQDIWLNNAAGDGWFDISPFRCPSSISGRNWSVLEEFRDGGAQGLGLAAPGASTAAVYYGYGYGRNAAISQYFWPQIRIHYDRYVQTS